MTGPVHPADGSRQLSHEQALEWIARRRAWRRARKTRPMWARLVAPDEVGREFLTADHVAQQAREGYWLCAGVAGEPWFQVAERIEDKYDRVGEERRRFAFDAVPRVYGVYRPREDVVNWAAQVAGPDVEGFFIRPNYDPGRPLYAPAGGYVVKDDTPDPYAGNVNEVWLVQQGLFESTYEWVE